MNQCQCVVHLFVFVKKACRQFFAVAAQGLLLNIFLTRIYFDLFVSDDREKATDKRSTGVDQRG